MALKAVFFDMDGLVIDSERPCYEVDRKILKKWGYDLTTDQYAHLCGMRGDEIRVAMRKMFPDLDIDEYNREFASQFQKEVLSKPQDVKPGFFELERELSSRGIKKYIVTSSGKEHAEGSLTRAGIIGYFDMIIPGETVKRSKPAPDMYLHAQQAAGVARDECLIFEDSIAGVGSAINAGIACICVPDLVVPPQELTSKCLAVVDTLADAIPYLDRIPASGGKN
ncbi:MAG: HAD family hydrolase [Oscillospiraceae bacterium]|jgi:HAD superfamily hydrolase (TIGR01509 family)